MPKRKFAGTRCDALLGLHCPAEVVQAYRYARAQLGAPVVDAEIFRLIYALQSQARKVEERTHEPVKSAQ